GNLAAAYWMLNKYEQAEPLFVRTLELKRRALGDENPETLDTMTNLAEVYFFRGDYKDAEALCTTALAAYSRILGDSHPRPINASSTPTRSRTQWTSPALTSSSRNMPRLRLCCARLYRRMKRPSQTRGSASKVKPFSGRA